MAVLAVRDYQGREVVLTDERWAHIRERRGASSTLLARITEALTAPRLVTRDRAVDHGENHYGPWHGRLAVKVCVRYHPIPDPADPRQSVWQGEILTAHPTDRVKAKEDTLWP